MDAAVQYLNFTKKEAQEYLKGEPDEIIGELEGELLLYMKDNKLTETQLMNLIVYLRHISFEGVEKFFLQLTNNKLSLTEALEEADKMDGLIKDVINCLGFDEETIVHLVKEVDEYKKGLGI